MDRSRVAVLYEHPLFGKGIAKLLERDTRLEVRSEPAPQEDLVSLILEMLPDALVLEGFDDPEKLKTLLDGLPPISVTVVHIEGNNLEAYRERRRVIPSPPSLLDSILHAS